MDNFTPPPVYFISVVLTLVATSTVKSPITVGLAPSSSWALHIVPTKGGIRGSSSVLAGIRVFLGEEG